MRNGALQHSVPYVQITKGETKGGSDRSAKLVTIQWCNLKSTQIYGRWSVVDRVGLMVFGSSLSTTVMVWAPHNKSTLGCGDIIPRDFR